MKRDLKDPAVAPAFMGWRRRSKLGHGGAGASPGAASGRARSRRDGTARIALLALACGLFALLSFAGAAGAAGPTVDPASPFTAGSPNLTNAMAPTYIAVSQRSSDVYVIDDANDSVDVFDANGAFLSHIAGSSTTNTTFNFGGEDDIAIDNSGGPNDGNIYVTSEHAGLMFAFNSSGTELWESNHGVSDICGDAVDGAGNPWFGDFGNGVQELNAADGTTVGSPFLSSVSPCHIAFDSSENVAVLPFNGGVDIYTPGGGTLLHSDHSGLSEIEVAVDATTDEAYTVDSSGVTIWDSLGNALAETPFGPGNAKSVAVNPVNGKVYITEPSQVDIYDLPVSHTVSVTVNGAGSGTVDADSGLIRNCSSGGGTCSDRYEDSSTVTLAATPAPGSTFTGWTNCDNPGGNTCTVSVTGDRNVTATFDPTPRFVLRVAGAGSGSGTVTSSDSRISCGSTCQATYLLGDPVLLTATPAPGSVFSRWSGGGCSGTSTCGLTMTADTAVTATFDQMAPTVTTGAASGVTQVSATVAATVNPQGVATSCRFDYGTSTSYGASAPCAADPGTGTSAAPVSAALSGLAAGTTYHYRIVASNAGGTSPGADGSFTTQSAPVRTCQTDATLCPPPVPGVLHLAKATVTNVNGKVAVQLSCVGRTACHATLRVTARVRQVVRQGRSHKRKVRIVTVVVAKGSVQIAAGGSRRVTFTLTRAGRQLLARSPQIKTTLAGGTFKHALVIRNKPKPSKKKH